MSKQQSFETLSFYRGFINVQKPSTPLIFATRKNRTPRDMPEDLHNYSNEWFYRRFGVYYRSQALFVTGSKFIALNYAADRGFVARIIPLGTYRYCWSPKNSDLLFLRSRPENVTVESYLDSSEYREFDLEAARASGNEVMLYCDSYVAIPIDLLSEDRIEVTSNILLP